MFMGSMAFDLGEDLNALRDMVHKWAQEHSQPIIEAGVTEQNTLTFTCVRNPYTRILSSFFLADSHVRVDCISWSVGRVVSVRKANIHWERRISHELGTSRHHGVTVRIWMHVCVQFILSFLQETCVRV